MKKLLQHWDIGIRTAPVDVYHQSTMLQTQVNNCIRTAPVDVYPLCYSAIKGGQ